MRNSYAFSRCLLNLSRLVQLGIVVISVFFSLVIFMANFEAGVDHNPIIFVIPIVLSAWLFRRLGLILCLTFLLITTYLYTIITSPGSLYSTNFYFLLCTLSQLVIGGLICSQRDSLDVAEEVQRRLVDINTEQQKLSEIKDQFLQNVNHELRTPLTAIYGYLELLLEHNDRLDDEIRSTFLQHAMQSCDELQLLVNNVLDKVGVEKVKETLFTEQLVVRDILFEVLERFDPKSVQAHNIQVDISDYIVVIANAQYLRQIFRNLLSNAFKYVPRDTSITIEAHLYGDVVNPRHATPEICISVQDFGPGIPPHEINQLFGQFVRLRRDMTGSVRGSGLGLFLCRQFVEMMKGRIWVESEGIEGKGCCFSFTLPCVIHPTVQAQTSLSDFERFRLPAKVE
jgi:signal transduction histidine kinase